MSSNTDDTTATDDSTSTDADTDSKPFGDIDDSEQSDESTEHADEIDYDSPESIWGDIDPVEAGKASTEFERKELPNGKPVVAKDVTEGDIERYRTRVEARNRDLPDKEIGERTIMLALIEHYETPSFDSLTYERYKEGKVGYYNQFIKAIAGDTGAGNR
jgi:hypothetical protein